MKNQIQSVMITSGNFANGEKQKGNFTARSVTGERYFVPKAMMNSLGFTTNEELKFPFYALVGSETITPQDENGQDLEPVERAVAFSVFKTATEMLEAKTATARFALEEKVLIANAVKASGLDDTTINLIMEASIL